MANALYKAAVRELETVLPPRLVALTLHEGLAEVGTTSDTLTPSDTAAIVQDLVFPRLTRTLGDKQAEEAVRRILEHLAQVPSENSDQTSPPLSLSAQAKALALLREALQPFNIYFEWGETQKLRAQLSLIETEHAAGRDASELIAAAQLQLGVLQQKLSDQLSLQARELALLENALQASQGLSAAKVRRLAHLIELIHAAQEDGQRAPAEIERAHKLASDLRAEKLHRLGDEARELQSLQSSYSTLLTLEPPLAEKLEQYRTRVEAETLLGEALSSFQDELVRTQEKLLTDLTQEFQALLTKTTSPELKQLLTLSLKVLETTLPPTTDVQQIRDFSRSQEGAPAELGDFHRLEGEAESYRDVPSEVGQQLAQFLASARTALEAGRSLPDLAAGRALLERAKTEQAQSAESFLQRLEAARTAAKPLASLNSEEALSLRWRLQSLGLQIEAVHRVSPKRQAEIEASLQAVEVLIKTLEDKASTTRAIAAQLMNSQTLDDALGFLGVPAVEPVAPENFVWVTSPSQNQRAALQNWLKRQAAHAGITGLALFTESAATLTAGELPSDPKVLQRAVRLSKRRADTLGISLAQGQALSLTLETPEHTLVTLWLSKARSLVLVTRAPTWGGAARQHLEEGLPELIRLLDLV